MEVLHDQLVGAFLRVADHVQVSTRQGVCPDGKVMEQISPADPGRMPSHIMQKMKKMRALGRTTGVGVPVFHGFALDPAPNA